MKIKNFNKYINEKKIDNLEILNRLGVARSDDFESEKFFNDTKYYWSKFDRPMFYRGISLLSGESIIKKVLQDRRPKDTPLVVHDWLNEKLNALYGFHRGNSLFVSTRISQAREYGYAYYVFPIGKFDWIFNPEIADLATDILKYNIRYNKINISQEGNLSDKDKENLESFYKDHLSKYKKNAPIPKNFMGEVLLHCKTYWCIYVKQVNSYEF